MRINTNEIEEVKNAFHTFNPRWVQMKADGSTIVPYNRDMQSLEKTFQEVLTILQDPRLPIGEYVIEMKAARKRPGSSVYFRKETQQLSDDAPKAFKVESVEKKTEIFTDAEVFEMRVELEKLRIENQILQDENAALLEQVEQLESAGELSEPGSNKIEKIIETATPILDNVLAMWKRQQDLKESELILKLQASQAPKSAPEKIKVEPDELNLEQVESMKKNNPYKFIEWISLPGMQAHYNNLKNAPNE